MPYSAISSLGSKLASNQGASPASLSSIGTPYPQPAAYAGPAASYASAPYMGAPPPLPMGAPPPPSPLGAPPPPPPPAFNPSPMSAPNNAAFNYAPPPPPAFNPSPMSALNNPAAFMPGLGSLNIGLTSSPPWPQM